MNVTKKGPSTIVEQFCEPICACSASRGRRARRTAHTDQIEDPCAPFVVFAGEFAATKLRRVSMARTDELKLLAHEFRDHLPVDALGISPLDDIVGDFDCELHRR